MRLHPLNNWKHQFQEPVPCWRQNIQVDQQTEVTFWLCQKLCAFPSATFTSPPSLRDGTGGESVCHLGPVYKQGGNPSVRVTLTGGSKPGLQAKFHR